MKKLSQKAEIRRYLEANGKLTALAALDFWGCLNLKARIHEIRNDYCHEWWNRPRVDKTEKQEIKTEMVKTKSGKRIAEYSLD